MVHCEVKMFQHRIVFDKKLISFSMKILCDTFMIKNTGVDILLMLMLSFINVDQRYSYSEGQHEYNTVKEILYIHDIDCFVCRWKYVAL